MDVSAIKQGMIFYVDDCTADEKITFNNERFPMKRRPWVVVSNNKNNAVSPNITMCPIYTRSETKLSTQVYFKNGERDQIICCESITTIPKSMIDIKGYIGTVSTYIWNRIHKALMIQLSDTDFITKEKTDNVVDDIILEASRRIDIKNILVDKICDILTKGLNNTENNYSDTENDIIKTENDIVKTQMVIMDTSVENLNGCIYDITPDTIFCDNIYENLNNCNKGKESDLVNESKSDDEIKESKADDEIKTNDNAVKNKTGRAKGNKALPITMCKEFCDDCTHMTIDELNNKYHDYMFIKDGDALLNKRWKTAQRLKKCGMDI